jgi:hypothetical protein
LFGIEWLMKGRPVCKETSVLTSEAEVIADAQRRAPDVAQRLPEQEPDTFRLTDATGKIVGAFQLPFVESGYRPQRREALIKGRQAS